MTPALTIPEQNRLMGVARSAVRGMHLRADDVEDAVQEAMTAWIISGRPISDLSVENVRAALKKFGPTKWQLGETLVSLRPDDETAEMPEGRATLTGAPEWKVEEAVLHDEDYGVLPFLDHLERGKEATEATKMQADLFRLHYGLRVFAGQPRLLTKRVKILVKEGTAKEVREKWPLARKDLFEYHQLSKRGSSCPTCKRIAAFIRGVEQEEVAEAIDRLLLELRRAS